jgi:DNA-binding response OmpR family regulator
MTTTTASAQLRQLEHPQLREHQVWYNDRQHLLIIDSVVINCTPSEYDVLLLLLRAAGEPVPFARLAYRDAHRTLALGLRHRLSQRVSRLRARIWPLGLDILCLTGYGYLLLSRSDEQEEGA